MKLNQQTKILIVGLGLLGGSYALALKKQGFTHVTGLDRSKESVEYALEKGMIRTGSWKTEESLISEAQLIVFALYPAILLEWVKHHGHLISSGTVVTDVTGVKSCVVEPIRKMLPRGVEFIAAHPMAGREVSGIQAADEKIFQGANYIVVPTPQNTPSAIALCEDLGRVLGFARISRLSPQEHDEMIAFLSQLTHCVAVSLMCVTEDERLVDYTGDSFRDLTRIARINDQMWSELFLLNKDALLRQMDAFLEQFTTMRNYLAASDGEGLRQMMRTSTQRRAKFDKK